MVSRSTRLRDMRPISTRRHQPWCKPVLSELLETLRLMLTRWALGTVFVLTTLDTLIIDSLTTHRSTATKHLSSAKRMAGMGITDLVRTIIIKRMTATTVVPCRSVRVVTAMRMVATRTA